MDRMVTAVQADYGAVRGLIYALRGRYDFLGAMVAGHSVLGREIHGLMIGNGGERVLLAAAFHAQEWITTLVTLRLAEDICAALAGNGRIAGMEIARSLAERTLVLIPAVNPDGVEIALRGAGTAGRYRDTVARLGGDRFGVWQANARGVDLNHNYDAGRRTLMAQERAAGIRGPAPRQWCGPSAHSEPETQTMVYLCRKSNFRHVVALHTQGEEIYWDYPPHTPGRSRMMAEVLAVSSGYKTAKPEGMASCGGFKDWFIQTYKRPGFTIELGKGVNPLPLSCFDTMYQKAKEMLLLAMQM